MKATEWKDFFLKVARRSGLAEPLKRASLEADLRAWTQALTDTVVAACAEQGWWAAAKGHQAQRFPVTGYEYMGIDALAFSETGQGWAFPRAAFELENSRDDSRVEYSLWKVLNLRAVFRVVYCYRQDLTTIAPLIRSLERNVIGQVSIDERTALQGGCLVAVGSRDAADRFPHGFFRWWELNSNTGSFELR